MVNLFDIMRQAQHGSVYENMARQFGLSVSDAQRAAEALLPAFSMGLQRTSANPATFANVLGMMSSGRFAPFYDGMGTGFWPQARTSGNDVLGQLFGTPEMIRRIAGQAASVSGIGAPVLQQMMPALASVLMGGLFRNLSVEGFADFLRNWADWLSAARFSAPPPPRSSKPLDPFSPWIDMMTTLFGGQGTAGQGTAGHVNAGPGKAGQGKYGSGKYGSGTTTGSRRASSPAVSAPQNDLWTEMMKAWTDAQRPEPPPPPPPPPPAARPNPFEALSQMLQTGRDVQAQHMAGMQTAFDALWGRGGGSR